VTPIPSTATAASGNAQRIQSGAELVEVVASSSVTLLNLCQPRDIWSLSGESHNHFRWS
jgi:hypothetical protein